MWPRVLAQLFELLPHITRLVPMADKYFSTKTASEKATEAAMVAMAEGVRGDLGQVTKAHAGLYQQLQEQSGQIAELSADVKRMGAAIERVTALELQVVALGRWVRVGGFADRGFAGGGDCFAGAPVESATNFIGCQPDRI